VTLDITIPLVLRYARPNKRYRTKEILLYPLPNNPKGLLKILENPSKRKLCKECAATDSNELLLQWWQSSLDGKHPDPKRRLGSSSWCPMGTWQDSCPLCRLVILNARYLLKVAKDSGDEELCSKCREIGFDKTFSGYKEAHFPLGPVDQSWGKQPCALCRLMEALRTREESNRISSLDEAVDCTLVTIRNNCPNEIWDDRAWTEWYSTVLLCILPTIEPQIDYWNIREAAKSGFISRAAADYPNLSIAPAARRLNADTINFKLLKTWLDCCRNKHYMTCDLFQRKPVPNLRLTDCERLRVMPAPENVGYVGLSYVWGSSASRAPNMEDQNQMNGVDAVVKDATRATLQIGYSYLWVDRYCIPK